MKLLITNNIFFPGAYYREQALVLVSANIIFFRCWNVSVAQLIRYAYYIYCTHHDQWFLSLFQTDIVEYIVIGTVIQEVKTSNIAKEACVLFSRHRLAGQRSQCELNVFICLSRPLLELAFQIKFHATQSPWPASLPTKLLPQVCE